MRWRPRFRLRTLLFVIATLAVGWGWLSGIAAVGEILLDWQEESSLRRAAADLLAKGRSVLAAQNLKLADEIAQLRQVYMPYALTLLGLAGIATVLAVTRLASRAGAAHTLSSICSTGLKVMLAGFVLGVVAYGLIWAYAGLMYVLE